MRRLHDFWCELRIWLGLAAVVALFLGAIWVGPSYLEARAYNSATGKNVSVWTAMFVDLRVQDGAK